MAWTAGVVRVRVPATSANLGPGFDALGLALSLHDEVDAWVRESGLSIEISGEGANLAGAGEDHLVVRAMRAAFAVTGGQPPGLGLRCMNRIPHGRGLGSSAAATVAGILAARALAGSGAGPLPDDALLGLATELEGHSDNVAACLSGGLTIAWTSDGQPWMVRLEPLASIRPVICVGPAPVRTEVARRLLPDLGLHQDYRAAAMPETAALVGLLRAAGIPAVVSGAGPSVLALLCCPEKGGPEQPDYRYHLDSLGSIVRETGIAWHISSLDVERQGACVLRPEPPLGC